MFGGLRGYSGQISPAAALDAVATDGNAYIVDVRSGSDKEFSGIPDIPNSGRLIELEFASISDRKIRGQLRNVNDIEKQVKRTPNVSSYVISYFQGPSFCSEEGSSNALIFPHCSASHQVADLGLW